MLDDFSSDHSQKIIEKYSEKIDIFYVAKLKINKETEYFHLKSNSDLGLGNFNENYFSPKFQNNENEIKSCEKSEKISLDPIDLLKKSTFLMRIYL